MKLFYLLIVLLILNSCSFDDKSGIWQNENQVSEKEDFVFKDFKKISSSNSNFDKIIPIDGKLKIKIDKPISNYSWKDNFYNDGNNSKNFKYSDINKIVLKTKKLTKYPINEYILFENNNLFVNDKNGNIIIYSLEKNSIIEKLNFYKKKYKGIEKKLNLIIEKNIIYISDNIGYIYAYNYETKKFLWAKKFKVPFRSNLKLSSDKLIAASQNNDLLVIDKFNGNLKKLIPTEESKINNEFINNLALSDEEIIFLNTYGSLYSVSINGLKLNWFLNLNQNIDLNLSNIFFGSKIIYHEEKIFVSNNDNFFILDNKSGSVIAKKNFSTLFKPLAINNYIFLVSKNNFLILMNSNTGDIVYSYDLVEKVAKFTNSKKRKLDIKNLIFVNNQIFLFLKNSYLLKLDLKSEIQDIIRLPASLNSQPIFINDSLLFLDTKNKLLTLN
tara:strand:- start:791 stop:2116 length:1326 start_codon:yes stop_codon:yes gene_type:complete